jgi:hypothetical protein|tara:strand:- start:104 stop:319 length:216 start_codon:yes stop_codon:yes gene_type:complete
MKLLSIFDFLETQFTGNKRPSERSIKRWIKSGNFPFMSIKMGNHIFIDIDSTENTLQRKKNPLVERILNNG